MSLIVPMLMAIALIVWTLVFQWHRRISAIATTANLIAAVILFAFASGSISEILAEWSGGKFWVKKAEQAAQSAQVTKVEIDRISAEVQRVAAEATDRANRLQNQTVELAGRTVLLHKKLIRQYRLVASMVARLDWRGFTDSQHEDLIKQLQPFAGRSEMTMWDESEPEVVGFALQIHALLREAGWFTSDHVEPVRDNRFYYCETATGVLVFTGNPDQVTMPPEIVQSAQALADGLNAQHREARLLSLGREPHPERIVVLVCKRRL